VSTMSLRDAMSGSSGDTPKRSGVAGSYASDVLLLQRPTGFDWIEVRRVWRQIDHANPARAACRHDPGIVMSAEVVHDDDVAAAELRQQLRLEPLHEPVLVRRLEHRGEHDPACQSNRTEQREVLAPVHWDAVDELLAAFDPRVAATHGHVHPRFVEEDESLERDAADPAQERFALRDNVGAQTLQRPSALFFTT